MRPSNYQDAYLRQIRQICLLLMVSLPWIIAFNEAEGDKTYNLKIGFDLTHGSQGPSALRITNFEEDDKSENNRPALRAAISAASSSSSNENEKKETPEVAVEMKAADDSAQSEESDESGGDRKQRSTKGLRADEYEPQSPSVREALDKDSESENSN